MSVRYALLPSFFLVVAAALALPAAPESPAHDPATAERMLGLLESGTDEEQIRAARWLGLHLVEDAKEPLRRIQRSTDGTPQAEELQLVAGTMHRLIERPKLLRFRTESEVRAQLDAPDAADRADALRHLTYFGLEDELSRAVAALEDPDPKVRGEALGALAFFDRQAYAERVLPLLEDEDGSVRNRAVTYFWNLADSELVPRLVPLVGDPDRGVGLITVQILRGWKLPGPVGGSLVEEIGRCREPSPLAAYLAALESLVPAALRPSGWRRVVSEHLNDSDERVRLEASLLLAPEDTRAASRTLEELLASDEAPIRRSAAEGLARSRYRPEAGTVAALLADEELQVRRSGLELATRLPPVQARPLFRAVLEDSDSDRDLLSQALYYLPEIGAQDEVELLLRFGRAQGDEFLLVGTIGALGRLEERRGSRLAGAWYRELLGSEVHSGVVYAEVAVALRLVGDDSFLPPLAARLRLCPDEDEHLALELVSTISLLLGRRLHGPDFGRGSP